MNIKPKDGFSSLLTRGAYQTCHPEEHSDEESYEPSSNRFFATLWMTGLEDKSSQAAISISREAIL